MAELRSLIFELRPASLEAEGLMTTLRMHVEVLRRTSGQDVRLRADGVPRLAAAAESEVFRVAQEALQNAVRHAGARPVDVLLSDGDGRLVLEAAAEHLAGAQLARAELLSAARAELLARHLQSRAPRRHT